MQEALHDIPLYRDFCGLDAATSRLLDESTILKFRHLFEAHMLVDEILGVVNAKLGERGLVLKGGTAVDATLPQQPGSREVIQTILSLTYLMQNIHYMS